MQTDVYWKQFCKTRFAQGWEQYGGPVALDNQETLLGNQSQCLSCLVGDYGGLIFLRKTATNLKLIVVISSIRHLSKDSCEYAL